MNEKQQANDKLRIPKRVELTKEGNLVLDGWMLPYWIVENGLYLEEKDRLPDGIVVYAVCVEILAFSDETELIDERPKPTREQTRHQGPDLNAQVEQIERVFETVGTTQRKILDTLKTIEQAVAGTEMTTQDDYALTDDAEGGARDA